MNVAVTPNDHRLGAEVCRALWTAEDLDLLISLDSEEPISNVAEAHVVVDFHGVDVIMDHLQWCVEHGKHVVVGCSGFTDAMFEQVRSWLRGRPDVGVLIAENFSIGAALSTVLARYAARFYESVEIVEMHPQDRDVPSPSAVATAGAIAQARATTETSPPEPQAGSTAHLGDGEGRGAPVHGVPVHGLRMAGAASHQETHFGTAGEILTIRRDTLDVAAYTPGVLSAVRYVSRHPGLTIGIEPAIHLPRDDSDRW